jgi:hypothetical protein
MLKDLDPDQLALAELMSNISEAGYSAGWMEGLEVDLWGILLGSKEEYGQYLIPKQELDQLLFLANKCGCWIIFDEVNEETAIELEMWKKMYSSKMSI